MVILSPFIVQEDSGYQQQTTMIGTRYATNIMEMPTSVSIINREVIEDLNANTVHELIAVGVSGVTQNQMGADDFNIRGFRAAATMRNGIGKLTNRNSQIFDAERIEVIKGPSAMLLASSRFLGGAINVITETTSAVPKASVGITFGPHNYFKGTATYAGPLVKAKGPEDFKANFRVTLGDINGKRWKPAEDWDQRVFSSGISMYFFGGKATVLLEGYYMRDNGTGAYYYDFYDNSVPVGPNGFRLVKLNQYSVLGFSPTRKKDQFAHQRDVDFDATLIVQLTDHAYLRMFYKYGETSDRRIVNQGALILADNFTMTRTSSGLQNDRPTHNVQFDYTHTLPLQFVTIDSTIGADGVWELLTTGSDGTTSGALYAALPLPNLDTRYTGSFPNDDAYWARPIQHSKFQMATGGYSTQGTGYFQETAKFLQNRVILVGGLRYIQTGGYSENYMTKVVSKRANTSYKVHKYGVVVKLLPSVSAYYTDAQNINTQVGFTDLISLNDKRGVPYENRRGHLSEWGVKFNHIFTDKLQAYGSVVHYNMEMTNVITQQILPSGQLGNVQSARDTTYGWEIDYGMAYKIGPGKINMIANAFDGKGKTAVDPRVLPGQFIPQKYGFIGKYTWTSGRLKGLAIGATAMDQALEAGTTFGDQTYWNQPATYGAFASYSWGKHWGVQFNGNNLTNQRFIVTGGGASVSTGDPQFITVSAKYKM